MISGFEEPSAGTICYRGGHEAPWRRSIGSISSDRVTLFQDANQALFPWMTAEENVMFRSEEHTSELQSLMRISYAVLCLKKKHTHQHLQEQDRTPITHMITHSH